MVRYSFPVGLSHSLLHAGLSRRTTSLNLHFFDNPKRCQTAPSPSRSRAKSAFSGCAARSRLSAAGRARTPSGVIGLAESPPSRLAQSLESIASRLSSECHTAPPASWDIVPVSSVPFSLVRKESWPNIGPLVAFLIPCLETKATELANQSMA